MFQMSLQQKNRLQLFYFFGKSGSDTGKVVFIIKS